MKKKIKRTSSNCIWYKAKTDTCQIDNQMCIVRMIGIKECDAHETQAEADKG